MKVVTGQGIWDAFNALPSPDQVYVLQISWHLRDNGYSRQKTECVALAMGFEKVGDNSWIKINKSVAE
jgi:hypothetical protein